MHFSSCGLAFSGCGRCPSFSSSTGLDDSLRSLRWSPTTSCLVQPTASWEAFRPWSPLLWGTTRDMLDYYCLLILMSCTYCMYPITCTVILNTILHALFDLIHCLFPWLFNAGATTAYSWAGVATISSTPVPIRCLKHCKHPTLLGTTYRYMTLCRIL